MLKTVAYLNNLEDIIGISPKTDIKIGIEKFVNWYTSYKKQEI